jgi:hypothetical protein
MNTNLNIKIGRKPLVLLWGIKNDLLPVSGILVLPSYSTSWNGSGLRKSWPWNFEPCCVSKLAKTIWICACLPQTSSTHQTSQGHFVKCQLWGTWTPQIKITNVRSEYIFDYRGNSSTTLAEEIWSDMSPQMKKAGPILKTHPTE